MDRQQQIQNIKYFFRTLDYRDGITDETPRILATFNASGPNPEAEDEPAATSNGERVAKTWERSDVAAKRNTRDGVKVTVSGQFTTHKSTFAAFVAYSLPEKHHVKFRAELKRDRSKLFSWEGVNYLFELIPLDQVASE